MAALFSLVMLQKRDAEEDWAEKRPPTRAASNSFSDPSTGRDQGLYSRDTARSARPELSNPGDSRSMFRHRSSRSSGGAGDQCKRRALLLEPRCLPRLRQ